MAKKQYLDKQGVEAIISNIKSGYVQKKTGKDLSTNDFTDDYQAKIDDLPNIYMSQTKHNQDMTGKVDKVDGKGLSTNDYSTAEKTKLSGVETGAQKNVVETVKRNGTVVPISGKCVDINVPTKVSDLTNDKNYMTQIQVNQAISEAEHMSKKIVESLPETGEENILYLTKSEDQVAGNVYSEYIWLDSTWEKIGDTSTEVDLSGYLRTADVEAIPLSEIQELLK